jgi:glycolate oxidase subunit GlcD
MVGAINYKELEPQLSGIVGSRYVLTSPVDLAVYDCDGETLDRALPDMVVLPRTTAEVAAVVKLAAKYGLTITPRGAGTGLSGGATPLHGGISLVLTRMTDILSINGDDFCAHVQVGVTNTAVSKAADKLGLYFAPDPSSQVAATIGGNVAENAGGAHTLKYGLTTNNVVGLQVVLADGSVTTFGGRARYAVGMDLLGFFVGSEGTLGIATEAWLKLIPRAQAVQTLLAYFPSIGDGGQAVSDIVAQGIIPAAMEMVDQLTLRCVEAALNLGLNTDAGAVLIVELDGPAGAIAIERQTVEQCCRARGCLELRWAADEKERASIWKARKSAFGTLGRIAPHGYVLDGVVPRSRLKEAIAEIEKIGQHYQLPISNIFHAGDGNLHPCLLYNRDDADQVMRVLQAAREILELCVKMGGTLSGEHGIGVEKIREMTVAFSEADLDMMRALRSAFDPQQLFNPGKLIPAPKSCGESGGRPLLRHQLSAC